MSSAHPKITIEQTKAAIIFPFKNIGAVAKLGLFPLIFAVTIIIAVFVHFMPMNFNAQSPAGIVELERSLLPAQLISQLVLVIFGSIFAVGIHRYIILGSRPEWTFFRFRKYELFYILTNIVIMLILMATYALIILVLSYFIPSELSLAPGVPTPPVLILVLFVLFCLYVWIYSKLALALPNAAITGHLSLATSWNALRDNFWRFLGYAIVIFLAYMLIYIVYKSIGLMIFNIFPSIYFRLLLSIGGNILLVLLGVAFVAYLSFVYQQLVAKPAQDAWAQNGGTV